VVQTEVEEDEEEEEEKVMEKKNWLRIPY